MSASVTAGDDYWPELRFGDWSESAETLHMWTQIIGKIRMVQSPWMNHSWHVTLYVTPRGLTTGTIPHGNLTFSIDFDFIDHRLLVSVSDGQRLAFSGGEHTTWRKAASDVGCSEIRKFGVCLRLGGLAGVRENGENPLG